MIAANSWAETKSEIDRVLNQAKADRARTLRRFGTGFTATIKRLFRLQPSRKGAAA